MTSYLLLVVSALLLTIQIIHGYPSGAPKKVCTGSMLPHHRHYTPQPLAKSPITKFNSTWNSDDETISVIIESKENIKGIFIQGRKLNGDEPLGTFIDIPSSTHLVQCPTGDGLTHSSRQQWSQLKLKWKKPSSMKAKETVQFCSIRYSLLRRYFYYQILILINLLVLLNIILNVSVSLSYYARGYIQPQTKHFCRYWEYIDYITSGCVIWCNAILTIQRYLLVFHPHYLRSKRQKVFLHYLPIILSNFYIIMFYACVIWIVPCNAVNDYTANLCGEGCIEDVPSLSTFNWFFNILFPVFTVIFGSCILLVRVLWTRRKMQRNLRNWSKNWKMIVQLLGIAIVYSLVWLPLSAVSVINIFKKDDYLDMIGDEYLYYVTYLADMCIPIVALIVSPEINGRLRRQIRPTVATSIASRDTV
ncbi:hypothetical protein I4U23_009491 [Adineta vaga]|nr:hypothetical protein I4U23_009491 [Adineta vaga]